MSAIINGDSPSVTFSDGTTQATSAIVSGYVPYANLPAGSVLQTVSASITSSTSTSSTSFVTTNLTASITPKFSTSKILVIVSGGMVTANSSAQQLLTSIYRNTTNLAGSVGMAEYYNASGGQFQAPTSMSYLDSPATTSSTSYTMYIRAGGAYTVYFNADAVTATITLMEIAQ